MKELNLFRKFLAENQTTEYPEFVGETNKEANDLANIFVTHIESELKKGETAGRLDYIEYHTSDESDPDFIANNKWYYDLARYMEPFGDEVVITATKHTPSIQLNFDAEDTNDITWKVVSGESLNEAGPIDFDVIDEVTIAVDLNQPMTVTFNIDDFGSDDEFHKFVSEVYDDESVAYGAFFQNMDFENFLDRADQDKFTISVTDDSGTINENIFTRAKEGLDNFFMRATMKYLNDVSSMVVTIVDDMEQKEKSNEEIGKMLAFFKSQAGTHPKMAKKAEQIAAEMNITL